MGRCNQARHRIATNGSDPSPIGSGSSRWPTRDPFSSDLDCTNRWAGERWPRTGSPPAPSSSGDRGCGDGGGDRAVAN
ncbi:hypothetical protein ABZP36_010797 [Zizania latifolia]